METSINNDRPTKTNQLLTHFADQLCAEWTPTYNSFFLSKNIQRNRLFQVCKFKKLLSFSPTTISEAQPKNNQVVVKLQKSHFNDNILNKNPQHARIVAKLLFVRKNCHLIQNLCQRNRMLLNYKRSFVNFSMANVRMQILSDDGAPLNNQ